MRDKKGFTLVELMVVVIIVGILATMAVPYFYSIKARAIATEAVMGMSAMRQTIKNYSIEYSGPITVNLSGPSYSPPSIFSSINPDDFDGTYFSKECYSGSTQTGYGMCSFNNNTYSSRKDEIGKLTNGSGAYMKMTASGKITQFNFSRSGYPSD